MTDFDARLRRLDYAIEAETASLLRRKDDAETAIDELIGIAATLDRPAPSAAPGRRSRVLRLGPLTLTISTDRTDNEPPDDEDLP
ncbi:hypothetical protein FHX82_005193 [Amycolatopsis bartoniae]|uniref:Uncharacterized protein n=1 Tax=Amycolatopsis bartoniae TaxID=941986 RepID=A0A8H9M9Z1_9PSEU|nr:hypothetical protein [Amycolatopsis bartoniae]MBB2938117.1 hypothetical protein [Amycolatopsis bartoniae]TVT01264.1 hypothetical protein FNH07_29890 [Amycolatopsis bartoniae]GHF32783.1 hypothetical protein GCM10017566_01710 [Amycolatopsis bartoniae]